MFWYRVLVVFHFHVMRLLAERMAAIVPSLVLRTSLALYHSRKMISMNIECNNLNLNLGYFVSQVASFRTSVNLSRKSLELPDVAMLKLRNPMRQSAQTYHVTAPHVLFPKAAMVS